MIENYKNPKYSPINYTYRTYKQHLGVTHPELAKEYHNEKNILKIENIKKGSEHLVWWKCNTCNHSWQKKIMIRAKGDRGCPVCNPKKVKLEKSLQAKHPELANEWHPTKNENLKPIHVGAKSGMKAWWKCSNKGCDNEWTAMVFNRTAKNRTGCPSCSKKDHTELLKKINRIEQENNLLKTHPNFERCFDKDKNYPLELKHLTSKSNRTVYWKCPHCQHSFEEKVILLIGITKRQTCQTCKKSLIN